MANNDIGNPIDANDSLPNDPTENFELRDFNVPKDKEQPDSAASLEESLLNNSNNGVPLVTPQARIVEIEEVLKNVDGDTMGFKAHELGYDPENNDWEENTKGGIWGYKDHASSYPALLQLDKSQDIKVGDRCMAIPATNDLKVWSVVSLSSPIKYLAKILEGNEPDMTPSGDDANCCSGYYAAIQVILDMEACDYVVPNNPKAWGKSDEIPSNAINLGKLKHKDGQDDIPKNSIVQVSYYPDMNYVNATEEERKSLTDNSIYLYELVVEKWFNLNYDNRDGSYTATEAYPSAPKEEESGSGCKSSVEDAENGCVKDKVDSEITIYEVNNLYGLKGRTVRGYLSRDKDNKPKWLFDVGGSYTTWAELTDCGPNYQATQIGGDFVWENGCLIEEVNGIKDLKGHKVMVTVTGSITGPAVSRCELNYLKIIQKCYGDEAGRKVSESILYNTGVIAIKDEKESSEDCPTDPKTKAIRAIKTEGIIGTQFGNYQLKVRTQGECIYIYTELYTGTTSTTSTEEGDEGGGSSPGGPGIPGPPGPQGDKGDKGDKGDPADITCEHIKLFREEDNLILEINGTRCASINLCCDDEDEDDSSEEPSTTGSTTTLDCCIPKIEVSPSDIPCEYEAEQPCAIITFANESECEGGSIDSGIVWFPRAPFGGDQETGELFYGGEIEEGEPVECEIKYWATDCPEKVYYYTFTIYAEPCGSDEKVYRYEFCGTGDPSTTTPPVTTTGGGPPPVPPCCGEPGKDTTPTVIETLNDGHPCQADFDKQCQTCAIVDIEYDSRMVFNPATRRHYREYKGKAGGTVCTDRITPGELDGRRNVSETIEADRGRDVRATAIIRDDCSGLVYVNVPGFRTVTIPVPAPEQPDPSQSVTSTVTETFDNSFIKGTITGEVAVDPLGGPAEVPLVGTIEVTDDCNQVWTATVIGGDGINNGEGPNYKLRLEPAGRNKWNIVLNDTWDNMGNDEVIIVNDDVMNLLIQFDGECGDTDTYNFVTNKRPAPPRPDAGDDGGNGGGNGGGPAGTGGIGGGPIPPVSTTGAGSTTTDDGLPDELVSAYYEITGQVLNEFVTFFSVDCNSEDVVWSLYNDRDEPQHFLFFELLPLANNKARLRTNDVNPPPAGSYRLRVLATNSSGDGDPILIQVDVNPSNIGPTPHLLIGSYVT